MSKIMRVVVLAVSLVSLFAVMSSAAGAVTWTNTGQTTFTATAAGGTLSSTGASLNCGSAVATGATRMPVRGLGASIAHGTIHFDGCRLFGNNSTWHCTYTLTANSFAAGVMTGITDLTCGMFIANRENCHIEGPTAISYRNGAAGVLTVPHSSSLITTNGSGGGSCALGSNDRGTLTPLTFNVTSGTGPTITID